ncbi:hypothetical protein JCM39194_22450 [Desulfotomaculum varum]
MDFWFYFWSALGIGALHALEPGHGKSIMGAYLIMCRGRPRDAILLGLTSAVTHTVVIVVMAVMAHSAAALALAGAPLPQDRLETWLKLAAGIIIVPVGLRMLLRRSPACSCGCNTSVPVGRFSGSLPDVLLLGFTNGLLPCPSALAVLLLSVSSGALASGLALVLAFGIGGAAALIAVGLAFVKLSALTGRLFERGPWRLLPRLSGLLIALIGALTACRALSQIIT